MSAALSALVTGASLVATGLTLALLVYSLLDSRRRLRVLERSQGRPSLGGKARPRRLHTFSLSRSYRND